jgi:hypothetical protein
MEKSLGVNLKHSAVAGKSSFIKLMVAVPNGADLREFQEKTSKCRFI